MKFAQLRDQQRKPCLIIPYVAQDPSFSYETQHSRTKDPPPQSIKGHLPKACS